MMPTSYHNDPTIALAMDLISRRSVTPNDDGCQQLMGERLSALGFTLHNLRFGDTDNLWAVLGDSGPLFVFAGHTDVVPTGPEANWQHPPFEPQLTDDFLWGRGAADMKSSLAAMITACEAFLNKCPTPTGRIGFLITSDEEGPATNGTVKVVDWLQAQGEKIDWCLVGEPSSTNFCGDTIKNGRRGSLGGVLHLNGLQGHVAYPHLARNPIMLLAPALAELSAAVWDQGSEHFPPTSFQVSNIHSGTGATNVIPGELEMVFNFRFSTAVTASELQQRTQAILDKHQLDYRIDWNLSGQPFLTAEGDLVEACCKAIHEVTGQKTELSTAGGTSDGRFIAPTGAQVVELGPVNATIHQTNERVAIKDVIKLSTIYEKVLNHLMGNN